MRFKHNNYAWPMIALYVEEADAIVENILDDEMIHEFYDWLDEWKEHIFKKANVILKFRNKKGVYPYRYRIEGRKLHIEILDEKSDDVVRFTSNVDYCDLIDTFDIRLKPVHKLNWPNMIMDDDESNELQRQWNEITEEIEKERNREKDVKLESTIDALKISLDKSLDDGSKIEILEKNKSLTDDNIKKLELRVGDIEMEKARLFEHRDKVIDAGCRRFLQILLTSLFYFTIREVKVYEPQNRNSLSGYKRHNDLYNPLKNLKPNAIIRPKNGTRTYLERSWTRKTESWHVKGHRRKYKSGKVVWVDPYIKGTGDNLRLSIYVDEINNKEIEKSL